MRRAIALVSWVRKCTAETAPSSTRCLSEKRRLELAARLDSAPDVNSSLPIHHQRQLEVMLHVHRTRGKRRRDRQGVGTGAPVGLPRFNRC